MPLCFIDPQDAIRVIAESVGREARRQLLGELVRAWVDEIPDNELASHYAKAVADLDEHDLSMLAAWHASMEVGTPLANKDFHYYPQPEVGPGPPSWIEGNTSIRWGNMVNGGGFNASHNWNARLVASYVTGSHAAKFGINFLHASSYSTTEIANNGLSYSLLNGLPRSVTLSATPTSRSN